MIKIQKTPQTVTPFAGISFVNDAFFKCGLSALIDRQLGLRNLTGYQYSDIIRAWFDIFLCGGDAAEDIQQHLRATLEQIPGNKVPSADTLLRGIKELAVPNTKVVSTAKSPLFSNSRLISLSVNIFFSFFSSVFSSTNSA